MRLVLILVCIAGIAATGWHAATRGIAAPFMAGAAGIEAATAERVRAALAAVAPEVEVTAVGRDVVLSGHAAGEEARDGAVAAAASVPLVRAVASRIELLPRADPFRLVAGKSAGGLTLEGDVPGAAAGEALLVDARAISPGGVEASLRPASGAPADWETIVRAGLRALAPLREGRLEVEGVSVRLTGIAADADSRAAALAVAAGAPGAWRTEISEAVTLDFTAMKTPDGAVILGGSAPDETVRDALIAAAALISTQPAGGTIELAGGSAPAGWETLVGRGLDALARTADGLLTVTGSEGAISGTVAGEAERAEVVALLGPGWRSELTVATPGAPGAELEIELADTGTLRAAGSLPAGLAPARAAELLPGVDVTALDPGGGGTANGWESALEALSIVLPRFGAAQARIADRSLAVSGELRRGFSADGTRAALISALPRDWGLTLDATETEPLAELLIAKTGDSLVLSGLLPAGLRPEEALRLMGAAVGEGLAGGGAGNTRDWSRTVAVLGELAGLFETARGRVAEQEVALTGKLRPGYEADEVARRLADSIPPGWRSSVEAAETPAGEGDRRASLLTGEPEVFRRGFWLPELDFPATPERCREEADGTLADDQVRFVTGSAELDDGGRGLVDRLAAIAVRCLNSSTLRLEIAGHTDSVGNDAENQALSEARARAVRAALVERGVREDALTAVGHGESQPVASNNTAEGRARNRRIAFDWSEG